MLPETTRLYHIKALTAFLKTGVPLSKIDGFRDLLEEHTYSLSDFSNLRNPIPFILQTEINRLKESICGKYVSIIFDGTMCLRHLLSYCGKKIGLLNNRFAD